MNPQLTLPADSSRGLEVGTGPQAPAEEKAPGGAERPAEKPTSSRAKGVEQWARMEHMF